MSDAVARQILNELKRIANALSKIERHLGFMAVKD